MGEFLGMSFTNTVFSDFFFNYYKKVSTKHSLSMNELSINSSLIPMISRWFIENQSNTKLTKDNTNMPQYPVFEKKNNNILVAFSSGKDCVASAMQAKNEGYEPILFHVSKINKSYPKEKEYSRQLAEYLNMPLIEVPFTYTIHTDFIEHPFKNQMIFFMMLDYGMEHDITNFAFGNKLTDSITNCTLGLDFCDSIELFNDLQTMFPQISIKTFLQSDTTPFTIINDVQVWNKIHSCILPDYRRPNVVKANIKNFGQEYFLQGRCGSCRKCALEYLMLQKKGILPHHPKLVQKSLKKYFENKTVNEAPLFKVVDNDYEVL